MAEDYQRDNLYQNNTAAWQGICSLVLASSLDSSLKRNTAFIKKARLALNSENLPTLLNDVKSLSLEKYLSEVVSAIAEGLGKVKTGIDIAAAIELVSALHQRFSARFTTVLAFQVVRGLSPPPTGYLASLTPEQREKDEGSRVSRQRSLLKVATELWLVGVFRSIQDAIDGNASDSRKRRLDDALPLFCIRELLVADKDFTNLVIATAFAKGYPELFAQDQSIVPMTPAESSKLMATFQQYVSNLTSHLQRQDNYIHREQDRLEDSSVTYGAIPSSRETLFVEIQRQHEKQIASTQALIEILKLKPLVLRRKSDLTSNDGGIIRGFGTLKKTGEDSIHDKLWEDEEQRNFYETLVDLGQVVPSDMLHEDKIPAAGTSDSSIADTLVREDTEINYDELDNEPIEVAEEELEVQSSTIGIKIQTLLLRLPELTTRESIDKAAVEFSFLNSKASRNRLVRTLLDVPSTRIDLLPYYARLIATLGQYLTSIADSVINHLHREFRRLTNGKGLHKDVPKRNFNIRYISELIKFGMVPIPVVFHCLKLIIEGFTKPDTEVIATMLEHCGRFLLRSEATRVRMEAALTTVMRKAKNSAGVERTLIENAFYYVNPPEQSTIPQKERSTAELYLYKLIYEDLSIKSLNKVLKQLKKFNWSDETVYRRLLSTFTKPWKVNFSSISLLVQLLSGMTKVHARFVIHVVDAIAEQIRIGLEENIFHDNQKRISTVVYLGELYNNKMIESKLILDTLYLLVSFGATEGRPVIGGSLVDPAEDFFRVRLVLALLNTCVSKFQGGALRSKVDLFVCFLQYYIKTKAPLPMEIEHDVVHTLTHVRPGLKLCESADQAAKELDEAVKKSVDFPVDLGRESVKEQDEDTLSTDSSTSSVGEDVLSGDEVDEVDDSSDTDSGDDQEFVLLEKRREQDDLDMFAEAELEREFGRLMSESLDTRKQEIKKPLDIALPRKQTGIVTLNHPTLDNGRAVNSTLLVAQAGVQFTFLSKKNKPRLLDLPSDSPLVLHNAAHRNAEEEEKRTIRALTLKYEGAQNREDLAAGPAQVGVRHLPQMLAGHKGGTRSGSLFKMGARER